MRLYFLGMSEISQADAESLHNEDSSRSGKASLEKEELRLYKRLKKKYG